MYYIYSLKEFYKRIDYYNLINSSIWQQTLKNFENKFKYFFWSYVSENDYFLTYELKWNIIWLCQIKKIYNNDLLQIWTVQVEYFKKYNKKLNKGLINKYWKIFHSLVFITIDEKYRWKWISTKMLNYLFNYLFKNKINFFHSSYFSNTINQNILLPNYRKFSKNIIY